VLILLTLLAITSRFANSIAAIHRPSGDCDSKLGIHGSNEIVEIGPSQQI